MLSIFSSNSLTHGKGRWRPRVWRLLASHGLCLEVHNTFVRSSTVWLLRVSGETIGPPAVVGPVSRATSP